MIVRLFSLAALIVGLSGSFLEATTVRDKIGQMLIVGFKGADKETVSPYIIEGVERYNIGGVLLYNKNGNIHSPEQLKALTSYLQSISKTPLFISIDQEGGFVSRLRIEDGFPEFVSAYKMGKYDDESFTFLQSADTAKILANEGINLNFAPVVDLSHEDNFITLKGRTFSSDPHKVVEHACQFISGHWKYKVATCLKHFPGHGSSMGDSHKGAVDITNTWFPGELIPFRDLIKCSRVPFIMSAHVYQRKYDPDHPASLSHTILTRLLRRQLHYKGIIITDDLQMGAIREEFSWKEAVLHAIEAGNDVLLIGNVQEDAFDESIIPKTVDIILEGLRSGRLHEDMINSSYERIMNVKETFGIL